MEFNWVLKTNYLPIWLVGIVDGLLLKYMNLKAFTLVCVSGSGGGEGGCTRQHSFERQVNKVPGILYLMLSFLFFQRFSEAEEAFLQVLKLDKNCEEAVQELQQVRTRQLTVKYFFERRFTTACRCACLFEGTSLLIIFF